MALNETRAPSAGVWGAIKGALNVFSSLNKGEGVTETLNPTPQDEFESSLSELEIIQLVSEWKKTYSVYYNDIEPSQRVSFEYWIGKQKNEEGDSLFGTTPLNDNLIFEAVETFLPIATRANPDPLVQADPSAQGQEIAKDIKSSLVSEADRQKLRMKLKKMARHWTIYRTGVLKLDWDPVKGEIRTEVVNPKKIVFDKDGHIDESGKFIGEYVGFKKRASASRLAEMFPRSRDKIMIAAKDRLGTKLEYFEWFYRGRDLFYTMESTVLGKFKNPHWNYDSEEPSKEIGPDGLPVMRPVRALNHFKEPEAPYLFLSVFSTGLQPHDETSLILQNIGIQDMINRRWRQIDKNVEGMNNGIIVSGKSFTEEQASQAASALRRGMAIRVPDGDVSKAVVFPSRPGLPSDVYNSLKDGRDELRNIFGTSGSNPEGLSDEKTARGKILVNQMDSSRIGGGVTEYIEQVADSWYNWIVQMMYVHWTEPQYVIGSGSVGGANLIEMTNARFPLLKTLNITVKEGSLIPKDPLTQRNEAIDLWSANAIDPRTFFKRLDYPDADEATNQLILWQMLQKGQIMPQQYLPTFQVAQPSAPQQGQPLPPQQGTGGPAVNPVGPETPPPAPAQPSPDAVSAQSKELLGAVPVK